MWLNEECQMKTDSPPRGTLENEYRHRSLKNYPGTWTRFSCLIACALLVSAAGLHAQKAPPSSAPAASTNQAAPAVEALAESVRQLQAAVQALQGEVRNL